MEDDILIDKMTGEVLQGVPKGSKIITPKQQKRNDSYSNMKKESHLKQAVQNIECGKFVWLLFNYGQELFPQFDNATITRLVFLSTFAGYDNTLKYDNNVKITKEKLQSLLNINQHTFDIFWNKIINDGVFILNEESIALNQDYFRRGDIKDCTPSKLNNNMIRLFINGVRQLYVKVNPTGHKQLSYLFRVIPYVNTKYNIVCKNPEEEDISKIESLTVGELCEVLGYDKNNARKLKAIFKSCTFGKEELRAVRYIVDDFNVETWQMFINPKVYFAGNDYKNVEVLGGFKNTIKH